MAPSPPAIATPRSLDRFVLPTARKAPVRPPSCANGSSGEDLGQRVHRTRRLVVRRIVIHDRKRRRDDTTRWTNARSSYDKGPVAVGDGPWAHRIVRGPPTIASSAHSHK